MTFFERINPRRIPQSIDSENDLLVLRERILQYILLGSMALGAVALIPNLAPKPEQGAWILPIVYLLAFAWGLVITLFRDLPYGLRAFTLIAIFYVLGLTGLLESGLSGDGRVFLLSFIVLANILLGLRFGVPASLFALATVGIIGSLMTNGTIPPPSIEVQANSGKALDWTTGTIIFTLLASTMISGITVLINGLQSMVITQRKTAKDLKNEQQLLESRIVERTAEAKQRTSQLEVASQIARDISSITNLDTLLTESVNLIRQRFNFYHAGLFLLDDRKEYAVLRASTGEAGRAMLDSGHRLRVGEVGMVGYVTSKGEPRIALNVADDPMHFKNPMLPDTRSELALPLRIGSRIIGALDVQSTLDNAFTDDDVQILQTVADQLAVAVEKASLVQQLQDTVSQLETNYQQTTQKAWRSHLKSARRNLNYRYSQSTLHTDISINPEATLALTHGDPIITTADAPLAPGKKITVIAIPIKLRNQVIGVIDFRLDTLTPATDLVPMLESITNRLSLALENARLVEEIQDKAERERMIGEIAAKMRASSDVDNVLRTAATELGRSLGLSEVLVQLHTQD